MAYVARRAGHGPVVPDPSGFQTRRTGRLTSTALSRCATRVPARGTVSRCGLARPWHRVACVGELVARPVGTSRGG